MAEVAECCGCCVLCCTCFTFCGRCCFWIPCPGDRKRAKELEDDELYAHQIVQENYLRQALQPSHYSADYRGPPQPRGQDPMVPGRNPWTSDPNLDQPSRNNAGGGSQLYPPSQPPDALRPPPASYQGQQTHQYPPQYDPRASFMSGITLQGSEEPGQQPQGGQNPNDIGHRTNHSGQFSQQEIESAHRNEGTQ